METSEMSSPAGSETATHPMPREKTRRSFLYGATAATGAAGLVVGAWPFIDQMNPDAHTRAIGDVVEVHVMGLRPAQQRVVRWRNFPVFVVRRTDEMLNAMREPPFVDRLIDPRSEKQQQPVYAKNWHRSIDPTYAVLVGVCTYCGCVPRYLVDDFSPTDRAGGYICECCASHYDPAGRACLGPAQYNLPVPPHDVVAPATVRIGKNPPGEIFPFEAIERI
jgi:ubiquinol-cytochrome c reductase iron-sulfur subunit